MALVTFGATARSNNAVSFINNTNSNISFGLLHGGILAPSGTRSFTFNGLDNLFQSTNERNNDLYTVDGAGNPYLNDVAELAQLLVSGKISAHGATFSSSTGLFTTGTALASATYGDGSVAFS